MNRLLILCFLLGFFTGHSKAQDTVMYKGQFSVWGNLNTGSELPLWFGARYIPQVNIRVNAQKRCLFDFEAASNLSAGLGANPFDSVSINGNISAYRLWSRFSTQQFEIRAGLQKINFGSAVMLRPLMWFDRMDARDPLQLTNGVWALLGRYYFLNNSNFWLWMLYGNKQLKSWEIGTTRKHIPEFGGRFQLPLPAGEAAFSFHHRSTTAMSVNYVPAVAGPVTENRYGLDAKWDIGPGIWTEATWIHKNSDVGIYTNQHMITAGIDYTFGIGNGINAVFEHMVMSVSQKAFNLSEMNSISGLSLSYPIGFSNTINAILYYEYTNHNAYNFINWKHQYKNIALYFMAFLNPDQFNLPQQSQTGSLFAGKGMQIMMVFNH